MTEPSVEEMVEELECREAGVWFGPRIDALIADWRKKKKALDHISDQPLSAQAVNVSDADFRRAWDAVINRARAAVDND